MEPQLPITLFPGVCVVRLSVCPSGPTGSKEVSTPLVHDQAPQPAAQALHCELAGNLLLRGTSFIPGATRPALLHLGGVSREDPRRGALGGLSC